METQEISAEKLLGIIEEKDRKIAELAKQLEWLMSQIRLAKHKQFGTSSEKTDSLQLSLFNEAESHADMTIPEPKIAEVKAHYRRQVGVRNDATDPAGSLHAKIGNLKDVMQNYIKNYTIMQLSTISSNTSGWNSTEQSVTISYNGTGILQNIYIQASGSSSWTSRCRATVTIDGMVLPAFGSVNGSVAWGASDVILFADSTGKLNVIDSRANLAIPFRSSLSVTIYFSVSSGGGGSMVGKLEIYRY